LHNGRGGGGILRLNLLKAQHFYYHFSLENLNLKVMDENPLIKITYFYQHQWPDNVSQALLDL
jgi:hypothetical protein